MTIERILPEQTIRSTHRLGSTRATIVITVLAILIAAGIILLAVDFELSQPKVSTAQEVVMPDGTALVLQKVTFGKQHDFSLPGPRTGLGPLMQQTHRSTSTVTNEDSLVFWFSRHDDAGSSLDFDWWSHCIALDEHDCELRDSYAGRVHFYGNGGVSTETSPRPFQVQQNRSEPRKDLVVAYSRVLPFRHSGNQFKLKVYDLTNTVVAEFDVDDPSPNRGQYPEWTPMPLPATVKDGDVSVTLRGMTAAKGEAITDGVRFSTLTLTPDFHVTQAGQSAPTWTRQNVNVRDAIGNEVPLWNCRLCPGETAWKLKLRLFRNENAIFEPSEQWSVPDISVPSAGMIQPLNQSAEVQGLRMSLLAIGGPGRVTHYGLTQPSDGAWSYSGDFNPSGKQLRWEINTHSKEGATTTTVQCDLPHVVARLTDFNDAYYPPDLLVVDDQGRTIKAQYGILHASGTWFWFMQLPDDAKTLELKFLVQKGRLFEFAVKPPAVEPTELFQHADELARRSQFAEAAAEFEQALEVYSQNHWHWYRSACLCAQIQDQDRYRKQSTRMLELFGDTESAYIAERVAKACLLWPESSSEDVRLTSLADRAVTAEPENAWFLLTKGIAEYRAGRFDSSVGYLTKSRQASNTATYSTALAQLVEAMAQQKLGQTELARESFRAIVEQLDRIQLAMDNNALDPSWHDWLICRVVRREAEQLFAGN